MDALTALHSRNSVSKLTEPAPTEQQLENIIKAGLRACDHAQLKPWKFLIIKGEARNKLGDLFIKVKKQDDPELSDGQCDRLKRKPLRAPLIIAVIANLQEHPKVPEIEQILSAGASAQMMMTAAHAQGVGAIWRSGALMFDERVQKGLGLNENQKLVGFLYMGKPEVTKQLNQYDPEDYCITWQG